jgi:hypothetical protein
MYNREDTVKQQHKNKKPRTMPGLFVVQPVAAE